MSNLWDNSARSANESNESFLCVVVKIRSKFKHEANSINYDTHACLIKKNKHVTCDQSRNCIRFVNIIDEEDDSQEDLINNNVVIEVPRTHAEHEGGLVQKAFLLKHAMSDSKCPKSPYRMKRSTGFSR